jgi:hypothetical protein
MKAVVAGLLAVVIVVPVSGAFAQVNYHFFPTRPAKVALHRTVGVLTDYGVGNDTGGLSIRKADGSTEQFLLAFPTKVNDKVFDVYRCSRTSKDPDQRVGNCTPGNVHIGKTRVRVTYWWRKAPRGTLVKASNEISMDPSAIDSFSLAR